MCSVLTSQFVAFFVFDDECFPFWTDQRVFLLCASVLGGEICGVLRFSAVKIRCDAPRSLGFPVKPLLLKKNYHGIFQQATIPNCLLLRLLAFPVYATTRAELFFYVCGRRETTTYRHLHALPSNTKKLPPFFFPCTKNKQATCRNYSV